MDFIPICLIIMVGTLVVGIYVQDAIDKRNMRERSKQQQAPYWRNSYESNPKKPTNEWIWWEEKNDTEKLIWALMFVLSPIILAAILVILSALTN